MLSRPQIILLKRAQSEAALSDADYRDAIAAVAGMPDCRSSKDARLMDRHVDNLMSFFEAIYWRAVDADALPPNCKPNAVFRQRGYWASKNHIGNTSRDRYAVNTIESQVADLEHQLTELGCGLRYLQAIQARMRQGGKAFSLVKYAGALRRTLAAKQRPVEDPEKYPF